MKSSNCVCRAGRKIIQRLEKKKMDYELEKNNLIKKLSIFGITAIAFTVLFSVTMDGIGLITAFGGGVFCGLFFYIPGRIKNITNSGWIAAIIITLVYYAVFLWLGSTLGAWTYLLAVILPLADIGISIRRVVSAKKES